MWNSVELAGKTCHILRSESIGPESGDVGPAFLWPFYPHEGGELERLENALQKTMADEVHAQKSFCNPDSCRAEKSLRRFMIVAWQVEDWNRDLSPWKAPTAMEDSCFAGGAPSVLDWLTADFLPELKMRNPKGVKYYLMGYSLAGLFALWSLYETDCLDGAVCCSASLWLNGWDRYAAEHRIKSAADIYLSLGGKEERTRNPMMAKVGDRTRLQEKILKEDPQVKHCTLEWNPGGHFADSAQRLAKGIRWVCSLPFCGC